MPLTTTPPTLRTRAASLRRVVRRAVLRRRRLLVAALTGLTVLGVVRAVSPPPAETVTVVVAARDLPAGARLEADDVVGVAFRPGSEPDGRVADPTGRLLAAPLRAGEPVTDARLVGPGLTDGLPGLVATPVRLPDAAMAALLEVGDVVDVLAADPQGRATEQVAGSAPVLALPAPVDDGVADALPGRLVVLGLDPVEVTAVAGASVTHFLTVAYAR